MRPHRFVRNIFGWYCVVQVKKIKIKCGSFGG